MKKLVLLLLVVCFALGSAGMAMATDHALYGGGATTIAYLNSTQFTAEQVIAALTPEIADGDKIIINGTTGKTPLNAHGWDKLDRIIRLAGAYVEVALSDVSGTHVNIPADLSGNPYLAKITFNSDTKRIAARAFANCTALEIVGFEEDSNDASALDTIGEGAFEGCTKLREFGPAADDNISFLNNGLGSVYAVGIPIGTPQRPWIGTGGGVTPPKTTNAVVIPRGVTTVPANAFANCTSISAVVFRGTAGDTYTTTTVIGEGAFQGCTSLVAVDMPSLLNANANDATTVVGTSAVGVTTIGANAFAGCSLLGKDLNLPGSPGTAVAADNGGVNGLGVGGSLASIPTVTSIGAGAFEGCTALTGDNGNIRIDIPSTATKGGLCFPAVETIGDRAFAGCTKLPRIEFTQYQPVIGSESFSGASALEELYYEVDVMPNNVESLLIDINAAAMGTGAFVDTKLGNGGAIYVHNGTSRQAMNSIFAIEMTAQPASVDNQTTQRAVSSLSKVGFDATAINSLTGIPVDIAEQLIGTPSDPSDPSDTTEPGTGGTSTPTKGSSSGGCDAGFGVFALALAGAVVLRKRVF